MEIKKNPKANLETRRVMFLQIGLIVALLVSLLAFEWKSYEKSGSDLGSMEMSLEDEDIIPITQREIKPPPPTAIKTVSKWFFCRKSSVPTVPCPATTCKSL